MATDEGSGGSIMRVLLLLALLPAVAVAFAPMGPPNNPSWTHKKSLTTKVYSEDPTKVWYAEIANVVQNLDQLAAERGQEGVRQGAGGRLRRGSHSRKKCLWLTKPPLRSCSPTLPLPPRRRS